MDLSNGPSPLQTIGGCKETNSTKLWEQERHLHEQKKEACITAVRKASQSLFNAESSGLLSPHDMRKANQEIKAQLNEYNTFKNE